MKLFDLLILLNTWYLAEARLPYVKSSGYYSPFPPKSDRVIYEFSPLISDESKFNPHTDESKSRETRDLAWRQFDAFLNGESEPSCADLKRMWRLARKLQSQAGQSASAPSGSYATVSEKPDQEGPQISKELQRKKFADDEHIYGKVRTHAPPPKAPQVRDPTKEILSGFWKSNNKFGRVQTHEAHEAPKLSQFQVLRNKILGNSVEASESPVYGTVHRFKPDQVPGSGSRFDLVRSILAREEGSQVHEESKDAYDRIRDRLLGTRSRSRSLRRRGSKKRRRNKKRRRRRKNLKKWNISRKNIREQNLLLKKLG